MSNTYSENIIANNRFSHSDRLNKKKDIERLFKDSKTFRTPKLRVQYKFSDDSSNSSPCELLISVPKRKHPKAVKRNKIKRLIREAWRKHKSGLYQALQKKNIHLQVAIIFFSDEIPDYSEIESKIILTLQHLTNTSLKSQ
ncbi:MAG: ribonuclease P protein component [Bacteroidales bacterium]